MFILNPSEGVARGVVLLQAEIYFYFTETFIHFATNTAVVQSMLCKCIAEVALHILRHILLHLPCDPLDGDTKCEAVPIGDK